jgi:acyl-CoA synthetase (AMP-forming)/AMP-acid ligase II
LTAFGCCRPASIEGSLRPFTDIGVLAAIERHEATFCEGVPTMFIHMMNSGRSARRNRRGLRGAEPDADVDCEALQTFCRGQLASYKTPKDVQIVTDLPKTCTGEIRRCALHEMDAPM